MRSFTELQDSKLIAEAPALVSGLYENGMKRVLVLGLVV